MLRYIPGLIGALGALLAFRLVGALDVSLRHLVFIVVYLVVAVAVDRAMMRYGKSR